MKGLVPEERVDEERQSDCRTRATLAAGGQHYYMFFGTSAYIMRLIHPPWLTSGVLRFLEDAEGRDMTHLRDPERALW